MGHSTGNRTIYERIYEEDFNMDRKKQPINKFKFDTDLASTCKWRKNASLFELTCAPDL